jgi:hypothetical protein
VKDEKSDIRPFADEDESCAMELVVERSDGSYEVDYYGQERYIGKGRPGSF